MMRINESRSPQGYEKDVRTLARSPPRKATDGRMEGGRMAQDPLAIGKSQLAGMSVLQRAASRQMSFCAEMETMADALPSLASDRAAWLVARLREHAAGVADLEERTLFPVLEPRRRVDPTLDEAIDQACADHSDDADLACELSEALETIRASGRAANPSALGYLMRCYFEQRRRHLRWEDRAILRPATALMDAADHADLAHRLSVRRTDA